MRAVEPPLDVRLRNFVLGTISERERDLLEQRIFEDEGAYDLLVAVEEEVLDECVRGALEEQETKNVLDYIEKLPDGRTRIDFARELRSYASSCGVAPDAPRGRRPVRRAGRGLLSTRFFSSSMRWSAAALVLGLTVGFLGGTRLSSNRAVSAPETATAPRALPNTAAETVTVTSKRSEASVLLSAGSLRSSADLPVVELSPGEPLLNLSLDMALDEHDSYRVVLHDVDARELFSASQLKAETASERIVVSFSLPIERLPRGDYFVSLFGVLEPDVEERLGRYAFRILRR